MAMVRAHGARSHVKDYLTKSGWQTTAQTATASYAANGFDLPDDEMMTVFADLSYLSAVLSSRTPRSAS
jgi:O-methyltransferase involved in polyketide biosynthesis